MKLPINYNTAHWKVRKIAREQYVKEQDFKCCFCDGSLNEEAPEKIRSKYINWSLFPPNFLKHPVHLHHDHATGMTIGAVHNYCNAILWQYHGK